MCAAEEYPAVTMDSGLLDMRTWFGWNVREEDTVKFRRRTTCNVLPREGFINRRNVSYWKALGFTSDKIVLNYGTYRLLPSELRPEATFKQDVSRTEDQPTFNTE
jgi:hypothetical protein